MDENRKDREKLEQLKKQYEQINMSERQVEQMKKRIDEAKLEKLQAQQTQQSQEALQPQETQQTQPLQNPAKRKKPLALKVGLTAAAAAAAFVLLPNVSKDAAYAMSRLPIVGGLVEVVTFRDYQYEDDRHRADVDVPELVPNQTLVSDQEKGSDQAGAANQTNGPGQTDSVETGTAGNGSAENSNAVQENLKKTTDEINAEIQAITDQIIAEFEENAKDQEGYQDIMIKHEILNTSEDYFTLKLICYQASGSGAEWDYFYTIDLETGERLALTDLFTEGADYITPISESIKKQMQERMDADENVYYWLNDEIEEWNFKQITDETSFYVNADNNIVISFNEGDVAPMYMGCVEFEIPDEVVKGIRK
jgi:hypothetical protein